MATTPGKISIAALLVWSFTIGSATAQALTPKTYIPKIAIKYSPLHLVYKYASVQVAIEHKIFRNFTMQYDAGVIFNYTTNAVENNFLNKRGYRLIGELRYYLPFTPRVPFYLAGEGYYHNIRFDRNAVVGYTEDDKTYSYYQYIQHPVKNVQSGGGLKFGVLLYPGNQDRFFFDINSGVAVRRITYTNEGLPSGNYTFFETHSNRIFDPDEDNHTELRPILGIRLGYKIK